MSLRRLQRARWRREHGDLSQWPERESPLKIAHGIERNAVRHRRRARAITKAIQRQRKARGRSPVRGGL
jgi:hypothetical protein